MTWKPKVSHGSGLVAPDHISDGTREFLVYSARDMCELLNMREQVATDEIERLRQRVQELEPQPNTNPAPIPEGWQLVPIEPTEEMRDEGREMYRNDGDELDIYQAMLAAAPKPGGE